MVQYANAIKLPFTDWKKLFIGAAIVFFGSLISNLAKVVNVFGTLIGSIKLQILYFFLLLVGLVPAIIAGLFITGYALRSAKSAMKGKLAMPEWSDWGEMFIKGLQATLITIIYFMPLIFLIFVAIMLAIISPIITLLFSIVVGLLMLVAIYILPMAIMNFVAEERFGAGFNIGKILKKAFTQKYLITFLFVIGYSIVVALVSLVAIILSAITLIGPFIVSAIVEVAIQITAMNVYAQAYKEIK